MVALSPQLEKYSKPVIKKLHLTFPVLGDKDNAVASAFGLTFTLPDDLRGLYSKFGIDLGRFNGQDEGPWTLPMPGRFIIDQQGVIVSAEAHPDYTKRPDPNEIITILKEN